jgi:hypothetical protein
VRTRVSLVLASLGLVAGGLSLLAPHALAAPTGADVTTSTAGPDATTAPDDSWTETKSLRRDYFDTSGQPASDTRTVTVTADRHTDLQSRERIHITWKGAHPTGGRANNPFGVNGLQQEYPVMIMECRGLDDPTLPADQQLSRDTCWTSSATQRSVSASPANAVWLDDARNTDADQGPVTGVDPDKLPAVCGVKPTQDYHITPFVGADGTFYAGCGATEMPPSAGTNAGDPTNDVYAFTATNGAGVADFEVRTNIENESLGCSDTVACSVVVIPIMGLSCATPDAKACNQTGFFPAGSNNPSSLGIADAVGPLYWWSPSNWDNRFSIPLTFAPPPNTCQINATGTPVPFYGSELLSQVSLQWAPAYCLDDQRFNWQANTMADDAALQLVEDGTAVAAQPSSRGDDDDQVAYAPTALTGWGIAFNIDKPGNKGQLTSLKLNARLLAKLLTESYPGSPFASAHPGLGKNPLTLNTDPEFKKLNPGLNTTLVNEASSTLLALSTGSGVVQQLTEYIAADPEAMAWIDGKPDPWGMTVNPFYKGVTLPVSTWPLLDTWTPKHTGIGCIDQNQTPYLPKIAAPVSSFRLIAIAMLLNWPNVNTTCSYDDPTATWVQKRQGQQGIGARFMLGLVTLGDARRYGLTVASLQAAPGHFVAPTEAGLDAAVKLATQPAPLKPFVFDEARIRASSDAYPGTSVVYTAAKTTGLDDADVGHVTQFIDVSTTEGQEPGRGNGQLPDGYVPIEPTGPTAKLYRAAQAASKAIAAQDGMKEIPVDDGSSEGPGDGSGTGGGAGDGDGGTDGTAIPPGDVPTDTPVDTPSDTDPSGEPSTPATEAPTVPTAAVSSQVGGGLLPVLFVVGVASAAATAGVRLVLRVKGLRS